MSKISITATDNEDAPITQGDIDAGKLIPRKRVDGQEVLAKKRVTLYLDAILIERFKSMAGERGYQTLINETLKSSLQHGDIEATIRKVIREELRGRKAA
jgi:uncharacterized protein (DUF4415 family)